MINIAFVCEWGPDRARTWSGTPYSLFQSLDFIENVNVVNISLKLNRIENKLLNSLYKDKQNFNVFRLELLQSKMNQQLKDVDCDAVIEIGDIGIAKNKNYYTYQDLCIASLMNLYDQDKPIYSRFSNFGQYSYDDLVKRNKWQEKVYRNSKGIFTMSDWLKQTIDKNYPCAAGKTHTVHAGINVQLRPEELKEDDYRYILFIGRDFDRKNGRNVIEAFHKISRDRHLRLIIAGPSKWPYEKSVPEDVIFLGDSDHITLSHYYQLADVFCMPSYFEAYGIVFPEALVRGIPCIGLNKYSMPEIIKDYGILVKEGTSDEIAAALTEILNSSKYKANIERDKAQIIQTYSWNTVANDMVNQIKQDLALVTVTN